MTARSHTRTFKNVKRKLARKRARNRALGQVARRPAKPELSTKPTVLRRLEEELTQ